MSKVIICLSNKLQKKSPSFKSAKDVILKHVRHFHEKNADSNKKAHQHHVGKVAHYKKLDSLQAKRCNHDHARENALARQYHDAAEKAKENFHYHSKKASKMRKKHLVLRKK